MKAVPSTPFPGCPVEATLVVMGGKWKGVILFHLLEGTMRFNELMRRIPNVTQRMLTRQLRELEAAGLVRRTIYPVMPPRVEYELSDLGLSLEPVVRAMRDWGELYCRKLREELEAPIAAE
jgi:DNA-binding HxlR family transcriptional regulator